MANKKFLVDIDLAKNQLLNAKLQNLASHPTVTASDEGFVYWNTTDNLAYVWDGTQWTDFSKTNLSLATADPNTVGIDNDSGTGVILPAVTESDAGVMTSADKTRLDKTVLTDDSSVKPSGYWSWVLDEDNMISNSDTKLATQQSIKAYVDAAVATADAFTIKGGIDCSLNPDYPAADAGDAYRVTVGGKIGGASGIVVQAGDLIICFVDATASGSHAIVGNQWIVEQTNLEAASETVPGYVELATSTETQTGTDNTRAVTPAGLQSKIATETAKGIIELATQAEVDTGTDTTRAVTPATLQSKLSDSKYSVNIGNGSLTSITIAAATHGLGTSGDFIVQVREVATGNFVDCSISTNASTGLVMLTFNTAPALNALRVVIKG
ncbi:MAG: hypothetical protein JXR64_02550 [Spirochaetales bacterium]|nr:hypothetical protein [Spirochaetales bacterium]